MWKPRNTIQKRKVGTIYIQRKDDPRTRILHQEDKGRTHCEGEERERERERERRERKREKEKDRERHRERERERESEHTMG